MQSGVGSIARNKEKRKLLGFVSPAYTPGRWSTFEFQSRDLLSTRSGDKYTVYYILYNSLAPGSRYRHLNVHRSLFQSSMVTEEIEIVPQIKPDQTKSNSLERSHHIKVRHITHGARRCVYVPLTT